MAELKKLQLHSKHVELGAKMASFAGFEMPLRYSSEIEEHKAVRSGVGIFDVSHMGEFLVVGENALDLVQTLTTNDASKLKPGKAQYSCLTNERGGIIDDLIVYQLAENKYMLVVNAGNIEKDWKWINERKSERVNITNLSSGISLLAVQGSKSIEVLQNLTEIDLKSIPFYHFVEGTFAGKEDVIISATGYTGSGGFELYIKNGDAEDLWDAIMDAGRRYEIKPCGLASRNTLRLEMGYCLHGSDIGEDVTPLEAGLGWVTKFTKEFIGKEALIKQKEEGVSKKLYGLILNERGIPRDGYKVLNANREEIGIVTSGSLSPMLNQGIALAYIKKEEIEEGKKIIVNAGRREWEGRLVKPPFIYKIRFKYSK